MFNQLTKNLQKYFGISRSEANGMILLMLLLILLLIAPLLYRQYATTGYHNYEKDLALLDSLVDVFWPPVENEMRGEVSTGPPSSLFDPNKIEFMQMINMGFDSLLAKRVIHYRKKGGVFYHPDDLLKIYDFPQTLYNQIRPQIMINANGDTVSGQPGHEPASYNSRSDFNIDLKLKPFDLNEADTSQLIRIKGIGPVFSRRIIKYRNLLGGFITTEQLREVYGLTEETLLNLKECVYIDSLFRPDKIRINFSEWIDLVKHPYINSELANRILSKRSKGGPYANDRDFVDRLNIPDSLQVKLIPYFEF